MFVNEPLIQITMRIEKAIFLIFLLIVPLLSIISCSHDEEEQDPTDPVIAVSEIRLSLSEATIDIGDEIKLVATVLPANATDPTVTWSSSSSAIATVSGDGVIKGVSEGVATILAKAGEKEASCKVTVNTPFVAVESVSLDRKSLVLAVGRKKAITATVGPENATDPSLEWSSSDTEVASVQDGEVTALKEGSATISVKSGAFKATCMVTVVAECPENTEIWYVSWTGNALDFGDESGSGANITSNEYSDGKGVLTFDGEVTAIPTSLFKGNSGLKSISLPQSVRTISDGAFSNCSTMLYATIQEGVESIASSAFQSCLSLRKVIIPSTVANLGSFVLRDNKIITRLVVPENVTEMDSFSLYGLNALESLTFLSETPSKLGSRALDETNNCPVYVPASAVEAYKTASDWKVYADRIVAGTD